MKYESYYISDFQPACDAPDQAVTTWNQITKTVYLSNFKNLYIFKALNETKNILTLSRQSDPIY
jgi:hypothetical protein